MVLPDGATDRPPLLAVAHRAGNDPRQLRAALDADVDLVEADVHLYRDALEVRHLKTLGPHLLWDRWQLGRRRDAGLTELRDLLAAAPGDTRLMLDLKGPSGALGPRVGSLLREVAPTVPIAVCGKHWSMIDAFADDPHIRRIYSASNRVTLRRLRERVRTRPAFGVSVRLHLLTEPVVAELRRTAGTVLVWPVDTPAALDRARRLGVSGVISKNLALLRELVASR